MNKGFTAAETILVGYAAMIAGHQQYALALGFLVVGLVVNAVLDRFKGE